MKLCLRSSLHRVLDWLASRLRLWRILRRMNDVLHPGVEMGHSSSWCLCGHDDCDNCSEPGDQDTVFVTTFVHDGTWVGGSTQ